MNAVVRWSAKGMCEGKVKEKCISNSNSNNNSNINNNSDSNSNSSGHCCLALVREGVFVIISNYVYIYIYIYDKSATVQLYKPPTTTRVAIFEFLENYKISTKNDVF